MLTTEVKAFVRKNKLGFIATVCPDGTPNLSPKGTTTVWDDEHLVFLDIHSPQTTSNLANNPSIEINMVDVFTRKGYRFKGTGQIIPEGALFDAVVESYGEAITKYDVHHVVIVKVDSVIEIQSPVYDTGATEIDVTNRWTGYWASLYSEGQ